MPLRSSGSSGSPQAGRRGTIIVEDVVSSRMIDDEDHERVHDRVAAIGRGEGRRGGVHPDPAPVPARCPAQRDLDRTSLRPGAPTVATGRCEAMTATSWRRAGCTESHLTYS